MAPTKATYCPQTWGTVCAYLSVLQRFLKWGGCVGAGRKSTFLLSRRPATCDGAPHNNRRKLYCITSYSNISENKGGKQVKLFYRKYSSFPGSNLVIFAFLLLNGWLLWFIFNLLGRCDTICCFSEFCHNWCRASPQFMGLLGNATRPAPILVWPNMGKVSDNRRSQPFHKPLGRSS